MGIETLAFSVVCTVMRSSSLLSGNETSPTGDAAKPAACVPYGCNGLRNRAAEIIISERLRPRAGPAVMKPLRAVQCGAVIEQPMPPVCGLDHLMNTEEAARRLDPVVSGLPEAGEDKGQRGHALRDPTDQVERVAASCSSLELQHHHPEQSRDGDHHDHHRGHGRCLLVDRPGIVTGNGWSGCLQGG